MMHLIPYGSSEAYLEEEHAGQRHTITAILPREEVEELYRRLVGWLPIETAPKDGSEVLLYGPCEFGGQMYAKARHVGWWDDYDGAWITRSPGDRCHATAWQPLTPPPKEPNP